LIVKNLYDPETPVFSSNDGTYTLYYLLTAPPSLPSLSAREEGLTGTMYGGSVYVQSVP